MKKTKAQLIFGVFNGFFLILIALICVLPFIHLLAVSFSSGAKVSSGQVHFLPVDFTVSAYEYVLGTSAFFKAFGISVLRVILGTALQLFITIMTAYPLSKTEAEFPQRRYYVWLFVFAMMFSGGMVPTYMVVKNTGLINSIFALIIPCAVSCYNILLLFSFFRSVSSEMLESAYIDGASHITILWKIVVPVSKAAIATITLFGLVQHWNSWFDGMIYMSDSSKYPLQTYLQSLVVQTNVMSGSLEEIETMQKLTQTNNIAAQIFVSIIPILLIYPILQKHFTTGIMLGSVKG